MSRDRKEKLYLSFEYERWNKTPSFAKRRIIKKLARLLSEEMGLKNPPNIIFKKEKTGQTAVYYSEGNRIIINEEKVCFGNCYASEFWAPIKSPIYNLTAIEAVTHELVHAYQWEHAYEQTEETFNILMQAVLINDGNEPKTACSYLSYHAGSSLCECIYLLQKAERVATEIADREVEKAADAIKRKHPGESIDKNIETYRNSRSMPYDAAALADECFNGNRDTNMFEEFDKAYHQLFFGTDEGANKKLMKLIADAAVATYEKYLAHETEKTDTSEQEVETTSEEAKPAPPRWTKEELDKRLNGSDSKSNPVIKPPANPQRDKGDR